MLAIDIGYGLTKAVSENSKLSFPSVIAPPTTNMLNGIMGDCIGHKVKTRFVNGSTDEKLVGEAALKSMSAAVTLAREKPAEMHDLLILTAAYLSGAGGVGIMPGQTDLVVGLPLAYYKHQKDNLSQRLKRLSVWVSVDNKPEKYISFNRVTVLPQGVGVILTTTESLPETGLCGVVDVGTYTTDYLLLEKQGEKLTPILDGCGSIETGIHMFHRAVSNEFHSLAGEPLPFEMVQSTIDKAKAGVLIKYFGKDFDLTNAIEKAKAEVGQLITQKILAAWGNRAGYVEITIMAGGGALLFEKDISLPCTVLAKDPIYANALGFFKSLTGKG